MQINSEAAGNQGLKWVVSMDSALDGKCLSQSPIVEHNVALGCLNLPQDEL